MERTIRTIDDLQLLRSRRARRGITRVVLELPPHDDRVRELERRVNRNLRACGCELGSMFVFAGIAAIALRYFAFAIAPSLAGTIGLLFALGLAGKLTGLTLSELALRAAIRAFTASPPRCHPVARQ